MSDEHKVEDSQLIKSAQDGNAEAFGELYRRYAQAIFRFLVSHLSDPMDAEDLTEDVFLRVWRSLPGYSQQGVPFLAYLFRVARNALIDHYRQSDKFKGQVSIDNITLSDRGVGPGETVSASLEHQEIRQTLEQLRKDYRNVLILRFIVELSPAETAEVMGRSAGAVRVLQHRALAALRKLIEAD
jgi:RNA polymerase sigma-70 factor (ECF subfamily)